MFGSITDAKNASNASLPSPGCQDIPTPLSALTNTQAGQPARKRKYDEISKQTDVGKPIVIQAPSPSSEDPLRLVPKLLIPRSCLPLAFLDLNEVTGCSQGNRLFSARILALEEDYTRPAILIVASNASAGLCAVERVRQGIYALCRLVTRVTLKELERLKLDSCWPQLRRTNIDQAAFSGNEWWHASALKTDVDPRCRQNQKQKPVCPHRLRLCMNLPLAAIQPALPIAEEAPLEPVQDEESVIVADKVDDPPLQPFTQDPDEILTMVRAQYQEALYISQASLAYFAKGPLSRARAYFIGHDGNSTERLLLPGFLRSCILSLSTMDKKYRDTLPSMVEELPVGVFSEDEFEAISTTFRKKHRKTKVMKIGKDGLYPEEEVSVAKWWLSRSMSLDAEDSPEGRKDAVRSALLEQRARETQLQIILVLETLALEASKQETNGQDLPAAIEEKHSSLEKKQKKKKLLDLNMLLELLIDRLCIWQSMTVEGVSSIKESKIHSQAALREPNQSRNPDVLHNFCVDVILPFYSARLPDLSTQLCQKLGGLKPPSPARPRRKIFTSSQAVSRPGALVQRRQTRQPRRTLERVLTEERLESRKPPLYLSRSITDSAVPRLKREVSEASLSSIPLSNMAVSKSRRYSQREVDLSAVSKANEVKLKKNALVDQELQGAIAALKRPNPRMAVKELIEAAEKRAAGSNIRKTKNPVRNPFAQGLQVMATPRGKRQKDMMSGVPSFPQSALPEIDEVPPSSALRVISSTPRLRANKSGVRNQTILPTFEQTPSRGPSKVLKSYSDARLGANLQVEPSSSSTNLPLPDLALKSTTTAKSSNGGSLRTPSKPAPLIQRYECSDRGIQDTPVKNLKVPEGARDSKVTSSAGNENDISIYQQLGWDDDADELI